MQTTYELRAVTRHLTWMLLASALIYRVALIVKALQAGDASRLLQFPFGAILPAMLLVILSALPPTQTREGLLMRVGAMVQLGLIILLPDVALYLTLGFPVVFLAVELFETRVPRRIRDPLARLVIA